MPPVKINREVAVECNLIFSVGFSNGLFASVLFRSQDTIGMRYCGVRV